jgi:peptide/nickel transport system substrate-binding protein
MYTVRLREGLTFSDGRPVNSEAALFTFDRLMASEAGKNLFPHLRGFNIIGDYTFSFVLDKPWPPFMASLALPQASLISPGLADREAGYLKNHTLGSGRFMAENLTPQSLNLVLRPDLPSRPKLDRVEFYYAADPVARLILFKEKEAHLLVEPPLGPTPAGFVLLELPTWETRYLAFNVQRPYLALMGARQALAAIARAALANSKFLPQGFFPQGFFSLATEGAGDKSDPQKGVELLAAVGPPKIPLVLAYPGATKKSSLDLYSPREDAEKLQKAFLAVGAPVNLVPLIGQAGEAVLRTGDYDLLLATREPNIPSPEMWLGQLLESTAAGQSNSAYFQSSQADELIRGFRASPARAQREQKIGELARLAEKESPYVFLYQKAIRLWVDQRLSGQKTHPMWPDAWPILKTNLNPFKSVPIKKPEPQTLVREFDELVAEPWE